MFMRNTYRVLFCYLSISVFCFSESVDLKGSAQGSGSKGGQYRPLNTSGTPSNVKMSGDYDVAPGNPRDSNAKGKSGAVNINARGAGIKTFTGRGGSGLSGTGGDKDQQLSFTFDQPTLIYSVKMELSDIHFGNGMNHGDDPVIFAKLSNGTTYTFLEEVMKEAFTSSAKKVGIVDFAKMATALGLKEDSRLNSFTVRETKGKIFVSGLEFGGGTPTPEPGTALILGSALALIAAKRKRVRVT